jgi:LmbE family N-acetylglucosaminyl deacetylase
MLDQLKSLRKTLVVVAHPDDEVLGCGGTMRRIADEAGSIRTVILGEGKTSRDAARDRAFRETDIQTLREEVDAANAVLGVTDVRVFDLPDNRFDTVALLDVVKIIEQEIEAFNPTAILTHSSDDMNVDHQVTNRAVLTAARPLPEGPVNLVLACEVLSSTGWFFPRHLKPTVFVALAREHVDAKTASMKKYQSELRTAPHPRSLPAIEDLARVRGFSVGTYYAEAFVPLLLRL